MVQLIENKMIKYNISIVVFSFLFCGCNFSYSQNKIQCESYDCIELNKNKKANVIGVLSESSISDWEWKIVLKDSSYIYINSIETKLKFKDFKNKKVLMKGTIYYGVVRGENDGKSSFAYGYRFDPEFVEIYQKQ